MLKPTKKQVNEYLKNYTGAATVLEAKLVLGDRLAMCYSVAYENDEYVGQGLNLRWGVWLVDDDIYSLVTEDGKLSVSLSLNATYKLVANPSILMRRSGLLPKDTVRAEARLRLLPWIHPMMWDELVKESFVPNKLEHGTYYPSKFTSDDMPPVAGYCKDVRTLAEFNDGVPRYPDNWNGWACPAFTLDQGKKVADIVTNVDGGEEFLWYDNEEDAFHYANPDWAIPVRFCGFDAILDTGESIRLYAIGSSEWTWWEVQEGNDNGE